MQNLTQPTLLLKPFAESGDKNTLPVTNTDLANPQLADLTNGFPQITSQSPDNGGLPPERKDFNALGYLTTTYDWFYQAGGRFTFNSTVANAINGYPLNAALWYTDNSGNTTLLRSTKANNKDNFVTTPSFIGTSWKQEIPVLGLSNTWTGSNTFSGSVSLGALATATSPDASDSSTSVATTAWANNTSNNLVHKSGTETITGYKTFTTYINCQGNWTAGTIPSSSQATAYNFTDSTGTNYGSINKYYGTNGAFATRLTAKKTDGTGEIHISIGYDGNGNVRATCPTPDITTNTTSTQIATTGWVNTVGNNVMHLTGDESIGGNKTFSGIITSTVSNVALPNNSFCVRSIQATGRFADLIGLYDTTNNCRVATIRAYNTPEKHSVILGANNFNNGVQQGIEVAYDSSNNLTITGKTPSSATDNSTQLATTAQLYAWAAANGGFSTFSKAENGYVKLGNGIIIQWGRNEVTASGGQTITLPTAFTNNNYKVISADEGGDGYGQLGITSRTTTNFTFNPNWAGTYAWIAIGY